VNVYLAGPMRGIPLCNHPAFQGATARLREAGHEVFSPAEHDLSRGMNPAVSESYAYDTGYLRVNLAVDFAWIMGKADTVVTLPGWEASKGAMAEVHAALAAGIPACRLEEFLDGANEGTITWEELHP
jgi:Domain of unknown function (DUF4406)